MARLYQRETFNFYCTLNSVILFLFPLARPFSDYMRTNIHQSLHDKLVLFNHYKEKRDEMNKISSGGSNNYIIWMNM